MPTKKSWWSRQPVTIRAAYGAALIAAVAGLVTVVPQLIEAENSGPTVEGNTGRVCIAAGTDNNIYCEPALPRSLGSVEVNAGSILFAYYRGQLTDIPTPSSFTGYTGGSDCKRWPQWLTGTPDLYMVNPVFGIGVQAGSTELVVVKGVDVEIFEKVSIDELADSSAGGRLIKCLYGGGSNPGLVVEVNTVERKTMISEFHLSDPAKDVTYPMPPGSISQSETGYLGAEVRINSEDGFFYSGRLVVSATINGVGKEYSVGSTESPLQWISDRHGRFDDRTMTYVGWDPEEERWEEDYYPGG